MAMETVIGLAFTMCRTLVMPPQKRMYLLGKGEQNQRKYDISTYNKSAVSTAHDILRFLFIQSLQFCGLLSD